MKKIISLSVLTLMFAVSAFAAGDDTATTVLGARRVSCRANSAGDPYLNVRGTLQVSEGNGDVRGTLRISTSSTGNSYGVAVAGRHYKQGKYDEMSLRSLNPNDGIDEIFINFSDTFSVGSSSISTRSRLIRMNCSDSNND